jgi:hypothetical protein
MTYNRYQNGKIYQITNNIDDMVYIGSTCLPLRKRIYNHKKEHHSGKGPNRRLFQHTTQYGWGEFDIILVEEYPCANNDQLRQREEHHAIPNPCTRPCRSCDRVLSSPGSCRTLCTLVLPL